MGGVSVKGSTALVLAAVAGAVVLGVVLVRRETSATRASVDRAAAQVAAARREGAPIARFFESVESTLRRFQVA